MAGWSNLPEVYGSHQFELTSRPQISVSPPLPPNTQTKQREREREREREGGRGTSPHTYKQTARERVQVTGTSFPEAAIVRNHPTIIHTKENGAGWPNLIYICMYVYMYVSLYVYAHIWWANEHGLICVLFVTTQVVSKYSYKTSVSLSSKQVEYYRHAWTYLSESMGSQPPNFIFLPDLHPWF